MQHLNVIGVEDGVLILEAESGERFRVAVDALPARPAKQAAVAAGARKASPREVQALIRGGMTAEEVATHTGEELAYVQRFEGPVLAEQRHTLETALAVPVASGDIDPLAGETTFGDAMRERLDELHATARTWAAWKHPDGGPWTLRLRFTTESIDHEATWSYEPKKASLVPRGREATALSQSGDVSTVLVPRLRALDREQLTGAPTPSDDAASGGGTPRTANPAPAVAADGAARTDERAPSTGDGAGHSAPTAGDDPAPIAQRAQPATARRDTDRFDSDAFRITRGSGRGQGSHRADALHDPAEQAASSAENPWLRRRSGEIGMQPEGVQAAAINRSTAATQSNHTAELLEALRRRRNGRDAALREAEAEPSLFEVEEPAAERESHAQQATNAPAAEATGAVTARKRGSRAAMPSWDEIVFGSRGEDDQ